MTERIWDHLRQRLRYAKAVDPREPIGPGKEEEVGKVRLEYINTSHRLSREDADEMFAAIRGLGLDQVAALVAAHDAEAARPV